MADYARILDLMETGTEALLIYISAMIN